MKCWSCNGVENPHDKPPASWQPVKFLGTWNLFTMLILNWLIKVSYKINGQLAAAINFSVATLLNCFTRPSARVKRHKNCRKIIVEQLKIFLECVWLSLLPMQYTSIADTLIKLSHKEAAEVQCKQGDCSTAVCSHRVSGCCSRGRHCCGVDHAGHCMSRASRVSRCCHALVTSPVCWLPRPSVRCVLTPGRWCRGWSAAPAAVSPWELHQLSFPRVPGAEARQPRHLSAALHTTAASRLC